MAIFICHFERFSICKKSLRYTFKNNIIVSYNKVTTGISVYAHNDSAVLVSPSFLPQPLWRKPVPLFFAESNIWYFVIYGALFQ